MNKVKLRRTLVSVHLYLAALLAPAFLLMATTGALYLSGFQGESEETAVEVPAGYSFNADDPDVDAEIRRFIADQDLGIEFDYIRGRGDSMTTRPTSRTHLRIATEDGETTATVVRPDTLSALTELHKGHGPQVFRMFGIVIGVTLVLVVIGGLIVGLLAPSYRRPTALSALAGTVVLGYLAFLA